MRNQPKYLEAEKIFQLIEKFTAPYWRLVILQGARSRINAGNYEAEKDGDKSPDPEDLVEDSIEALQDTILIYRDIDPVFSIQFGRSPSSNGSGLHGPYKFVIGSAEEYEEEPDPVQGMGMAGLGSMGLAGDNMILGQLFQVMDHKTNAARLEAEAGYKLLLVEEREKNLRREMKEKEAEIQRLREEYTSVSNRGGNALWIGAQKLMDLLGWTDDDPRKAEALAGVQEEVAKDEHFQLVEEIAMKLYNLGDIAFSQKIGAMVHKQEKAKQP